MSMGLGIQFQKGRWLVKEKLPMFGKCRTSENAKPAILIFQGPKNISKASIKSAKTIEGKKALEIARLVDAVSDFWFVPMKNSIHIKHPSDKKKKFVIYAVEEGSFTKDAFCKKLAEARELKVLERLGID